MSSVTLNCQGHHDCQEFRFSTIWNVKNFTQVHKPRHVFVMSFSWSKRSKVSRIAFWRCSLLYLSLSFFGQVITLIKVSRTALWRCSLNVFVFVIAFVSVFLLVKTFQICTLHTLHPNLTASCKKMVRFPRLKIGASLDNLILCRYFHDSLPYGSGPGTDTDLASVMNGEGNRRFDEVFSLD